MGQYYIWLDNNWVNIDHSMAHSKLGDNFARFTPLSTMFMDLTISGFRQQVVAFVVNDQGDRIYSTKRNLIKHEFQNKNWEYCIKPSDFMDSDATIQVEKALGNPLALELDK